MSNPADTSPSFEENPSFSDPSTEDSVPDGVQTSIPGDALIYKPSSAPQRVIVPQSGDVSFVTLTGLAQTQGTEAQGPDAGTLPENPHGAGTERFQIAVYPIGPSWHRLDQAAVFAGVGTGLMSTDGRHGSVGGHELKAISPAWVDGRLGVFLRLHIVGMGTIPSIQFQITCTGVVDELDPQPRASSPSDADSTSPGSSRYGSSKQRFESDDDRFDPFERGDRNQPFDDRDFER